MAEENVMASSQAGEGGGQMRRDLNVWEAIGISVALMAPSFALNANPQGMIGAVGRSVPLAFLLATIGVLLIAYSFVRLCGYFNHAGSVYGLIGASLGPRAGAVAAWGLLFTYITYGLGTLCASGHFVGTFLDGTGIWDNPPLWSMFLFGALMAIPVFLLASRRARIATRVLLSIEGATVALIVVVAIVVLIKILGGNAPADQSFTLSVFNPPPGTGAYELSIGLVFGFLSFAGFEAAASLGEETRKPRHDIPRAILGTAIFGGILYVIVTAIEVMGFGTDKAGIDAFASSGALFQTLSSMYLASWIGNVIALGIVFSAGACALACFVAASRLAYALARDAFPRSSVARLSRRDDAPVVALVWVMAAALVVGIFYRIVAGSDGANDPYTLYFYAATAGTIALLVAYAMVTLGAIRFLFLGDERRVALWEIVLPLAALAVVGYVVYRQMDPDGVGPNSLWNTSIGLIVPAIGILGALLLPGLAANFGRHLSEEEGLGAAVPAGD
jgi:amino acid transporter